MTTLQLVSFVSLWIVIIADGALLLMLYRHVLLAMRRKSEGLAVGMQAPPLLARDGQGKTLSLPDLLPADYNLLVFGSRTCGGCKTLLTDQGVRRFLTSRSLAGYFLDQDGAENGATGSSKDDTSLPIVAVEKKAFDDYGVDATPFAYVLTRMATIAAKGRVKTVQELVNLCDQASNPADRTSSSRGFRMKDVPGEMLR